MDRIIEYRRCAEIEQYVWQNGALIPLSELLFQYHRVGGLPERRASTGRYAASIAGDARESR